MWQWWSIVYPSHHPGLVEVRNETSQSQAGWDIGSKIGAQYGSKKCPEHVCTIAVNMFLVMQPCSVTHLWGEFWVWSCNGATFWIPCPNLGSVFTANSMALFQSNLSSIITWTERGRYLTRIGQKPWGQLFRSRVNIFCPDLLQWHSNGMPFKWLGFLLWNKNHLYGSVSDLMWKISAQKGFFLKGHINKGHINTLWFFHDE